MSRVLAPDPSPTQGPSWLAQWLYNPPVWVGDVLSLVALTAALVVAYRLYTDGAPDPETQDQMATILVTAIAVAAATITTTELDLGTYGVEVVAGVVLGIGVTNAGRAVGGRLLRRWIAPERRQACAWISLTALLWTPLAVVPASERTALLWSIIQWGLVVSAGMALLLAHEEF